jgi:hypothetical protein
MRTRIYNNVIFAIRQAMANLQQGDPEAAKLWIAQLPPGHLLAMAAPADMDAQSAARLGMVSDKLREFADVARSTNGAWLEDEHPRWSAGDPEGRGGQFAPAGRAGGTSAANVHVGALDPAISDYVPPYNAAYVWQRILNELSPISFAQAQNVPPSEKLKVQLGLETPEKAEGKALLVPILPGSGVIDAPLPPILASADNASALPEGSFSISDWTGYPEGVPKPEGSLRLLKRDEYAEARSAANSANRSLRQGDPSAFDGKQVHEIQPVKLGGSPTVLANKIPLLPHVHAQVTTWWNALIRSIDED